jgi:hypothetical protein
MEHWLTPLDGSCYGWSVTRKTKTSLFLRYHLPAILYAAAILAVSCIPNLKSPEIRFLANDKVAHFLEYAVFAFLAFRSLAHLSNRSRTGTVAPLTLLLLAGFAVVDELLQGENGQAPREIVFFSHTFCDHNSLTIRRFLIYSPWSMV